MSRAHAATLSEHQLALVNVFAPSIPLPQRDGYRAFVADHLRRTVAAVNAAFDRVRGGWA